MPLSSKDNVNNAAILGTALRGHHAYDVLTPQQRTQAVEAAQTSFTGTNWNTAVDRGVEQVVFGIPITPLSKE